jgi:hypothetical protein
LNFWSPLAASAGIVLLLSSCATTPPASVDAAPRYDRSPAYPHWAGKPATWSKLGEIEEWLDGPGPRQYPEHVATAHLELAEGRLALTRREKNLSAPALLVRLKSAENGFKDVLDEPGLKTYQRLRAEQGLKEITALRDPSTPARVAKATPARAPRTALAIEPRSAWRAANPIRSRLTPVGGPWSRITIHHSAKYSHSMGSASASNVGQSIRLIQTVHMRDEDYGDIGYHYLIDPAGRIWQGRSLEWQGAHAGGADGVNNVGNIGICVLGDYSTARPDGRALDALETLLDDLCAEQRIPRERVFGHREMRSTECPGDRLMDWVLAYAHRQETPTKMARAARSQTQKSASVPTAVQ